MIGTVGDLFLREVTALEHAFGPLWPLSAFLVVLVALVLSRLTGWLVHAAWRVGLDRRRSLAWWLSVFRLTVLAATVLLLVRSVVGPAPVLGTVLLLAGVATGVTVLRAHVENLSVGIGLVFRRRIRQGDHVTLGDVSGEVREIGLSRLHLRRADGAAVLVPNRLLNALPILVERSHHTARVMVRVDLQTTPTPELLERLRRSVVLSPFRVTGSTLTITREPEQPTQLLVEMQTHSSSLTAAAGRHLELTLLTAARDTLPPKRRDGARPPATRGEP